MPTLAQYSIVTQVPGDQPYTVRAYTGADLREVLGISQASTMPEGSYGWIQTCGEVCVRGHGEAHTAYADFRPNDLKFQAGTRGNTSTESQISEEGEPHKLKRLYGLTPLLIEVGPYCKLLREAREVFVDGHFYACVAMCGISFERFQRDKAEPYGGRPEHKLDRIRETLSRNNVLSPLALTLCRKMAQLRNEYAHGDGRKPEDDARNALTWMHEFIDDATSLTRHYVVVDGILIRK